MLSAFKLEFCKFNLQLNYMLNIKSIFFRYLPEESAISVSQAWLGI